MLLHELSQIKDYIDLASDFRCFRVSYAGNFVYNSDVGYYLAKPDNLHFSLSNYYFL